MQRVLPGLPLGVLRRRAWAGEVVLVACAYFAYEAGRELATGSRAEAIGHAHRVHGVEERLGIAGEAALREAIAGTPLMAVLHGVYLVAQCVALPLGAVALYLGARGTYHALRDTVIVAWAIAIPACALFPTAPPNLAGLAGQPLAGPGEGLGGSGLFSNPYAAMPSVHVACAVALGAAVVVASRSIALRLVGAAWALLVALAVVATADHFFLDVAGGVALVVVAHAAGGGLRTAFGEGGWARLALPNRRERSAA
jgi:hypothetical protein